MTQANPALPAPGAEIARVDDIPDPGAIVRHFKHESFYFSLLLTRRLDERGHVLYKQGKLPGSFYTCKGNEAASVGVAAAMAPEDVAAAER